MKHVQLLVLTMALILGITACSGVKREAKYPTGADRPDTGGDIYAKPTSVFNNGGISLFGGKKDGEDDNSGTGGIGVNSFLWRASLDTVSFMPLASADPFGGVILTDWYASPETPDERYKLNVLILTKKLRSNGIQVKLFRQVRKDGEWRDAKTAPDTAYKLEDTILTRARQMRVAQIGTFEK